MTGAAGPAGYAIAFIPVLVVFRAFAKSPMAAVLTGVVVALCLVDVAGTGIFLVPIAAATLVLAIRDLLQRPTSKLWAVLVAAGAFISSFAVLIVGSSLYYAR
jgi:hypothetical protein